MHLTNTKEIFEFRAAISKCKGKVWLYSQEGDRFNLKSVVSQYIALGKLLTEQGENLELFCEKAEDEKNFLEFFNRNPEVL